MKTKAPYFIIIIEGKTDLHFLKRVFAEKGLTFSKFYASLNGVDHGFTKKIAYKVCEVIENKKNKLRSRPVYVVILYDRDGNRSKTPNRLDHNLFREIVSKSEVPIIAWQESVATKDIEGWFFYDLDGLYDYLKVSKSKRNFSRYANPDVLGKSDLQSFFKAHRVFYSEGDRAKPVIDKLDTIKISKDCEDLKGLISFIEKKL